MVRQTAGTLLVLLLGSAALCADEAADQYAVAAGHYAAERWPLACEEFEAFLARHESDERAPAARFYLAETLIQLNRPDEALNWLEKVQQEQDSPLARQASFRMAEARFLRGDDEQAEKELQAFRQQYPEDELNAFVLPYLGELALRRGDSQAADSYYTAALKRFPRGALQPECQFGLARANQLSGRQELARQQLEDIAADAYAPLADKAQLQLGYLHNAAGDYQQALAAFETFEQKFKDSPLAPQMELARGWAHYKRQDYEAAEAALQKIPSDDPLALEARYWRGMVCVAREQWPEAAEHFEQAYRSETAHRLQVASGFQWAEALRRQGNLARAAEGFAELLKRWPNDKYADDAHFGALQVALAEEDSARALNLAETFLKTFPDSDLQVAAECRSAAALCHARLGQLDEARQALTTLANEHPGHELIAATRYQVADALYKAGDHATAQTLFSELLEQRPAEPWASQAQAGIAWCQLQAGKLPEAAATFDALLNQFAQSPVAPAASLERARILEKSGDAPAAAAEYRRLLEDYPASEGWAEASYFLARAALDKQDFDTCREHLEQLQAEPARITASLEPHVLLLQSRLAMVTNQWAQAEPPLEKITSRFAEHPLALTAAYWLAEAAYRRADHKTAAEQWRDLIPRLKAAQDPLAAMAQLRLAQAMVAQDEWTAALELARELERSEPTFAARSDVYYLIGRCLARDADFRAARDAYQQAIEAAGHEKTETAAMAQWMIGETYFHQEDYAEALRAYLRVEILYAYPRWQAAALLQAGKCHEQLGQTAQATEIYTRLLKNYPTSEVAAAATERLSAARRQPAGKTIQQ